MVNTDDEYYLQANTRSTRSRWDRHQLIPSSPFGKNLSLRDILKLEIVFLVTKYESMFYMPDYQSRDIPSFLLRTYIWARPVSDKRWQLRSPLRRKFLADSACTDYNTLKDPVRRRRSKKTKKNACAGSPLFFQDDHIQDCIFQDCSPCQAFHSYAQVIYLEFTGFNCFIEGFAHSYWLNNVNMYPPQENWAIWWGNTCPNCFKRFR